MSDDLRELMGEINDSMTRFHDRLESRAQEMELIGGDPDVVKKLTIGPAADAFGLVRRRRSGSRRRRRRFRRFSRGRRGIIYLG